jgi:putative iron-regulated protein
MNNRFGLTAILISAMLVVACGKKEAAVGVTKSDVVAHYTAIAHAVFTDSLESAKILQKSVNQLISEPTQANLEAAQQSWLASRIPYMQSEVFRFGNANVDDWEGQVNAWPLDEGMIDYVHTEYQYTLGNIGATLNIVANSSLNIGSDVLDLAKITPELLADLNELAGSEANVATGYHAIEFLLWGQDLNGTSAGAGQRPVTDYAQDQACSNGNCDRRAAYLEAVTNLLVTDLANMVSQWAPDAANYRAALLAEESTSGLRKMLFGMGSLSLGELAGERIKVALEANSTEDEHDCFSDNTHNSHFYNAKGIRNIYLGDYKRIDGSTLSGVSLSDLVAAIDAESDKDLRAKLAVTESALQGYIDSAASGIAFDQLIAPGNQAGRVIVEKGINALVLQTSAIENAAKVIGIMDLNPYTADHSL